MLQIFILITLVSDKSINCFPQNVCMQNDFRERRTKSIFKTRSLIDFTMGILYSAAAVFLFFAEKLDSTLDRYDIKFRYIFGTLCAVYGIWRIYRGYKKEYN